MKKGSCSVFWKQNLLFLEYTARQLNCISKKATKMEFEHMLCSRSKDSTSIKQCKEKTMTYNITLEGSVLKVGFGIPAQNDQIVKDAKARLDEMVAKGELTGLTIDLWRLWEKKTGSRVHIIATDWAEAQTLYKSGKGDVIDIPPLDEEAA